MLADTNSLTDAIVSFCQYTRSNGLNNGIQETITSLEAAALGTISGETTLRNILRTILCSSQDELKKYDRLFDAFWLNKPLPTRNTPLGKIEYAPGSNSKKTIRQHFNDQGGDASDNDGKQMFGASPKEQYKQMDLGKINDEHLEEMTQIASQMWRNMGKRLRKRYKQSSNVRRRLDLRKTIRYNMSYGGEMIYPKYRGKTKKKKNLVIMLDISGSMEKYSYFYLLFLFSLHKYFKNLSSFTFSTRLHYVTKMMQKKEISEIVDELKTDEMAWFSGTKISECLATFSNLYSKNIVNRHTIVVVISDGLDTGDPDLFYLELAKIKQRAGSLFWVNPLKGMDNYEPLTRGIRKILPLLDGFISGHNLNSLEELEEFITNAI